MDTPQRLPLITPEKKGLMLSKVCWPTLWNNSKSNAVALILGSCAILQSTATDLGRIRYKCSLATESNTTTLTFMLFLSLSFSPFFRIGGKMSDWRISPHFMYRKPKPFFWFVFHGFLYSSSYYLLRCRNPVSDFAHCRIHRAYGDIRWPTNLGVT